MCLVIRKHPKRQKNIRRWREITQLRDHLKPFLDIRRVAQRAFSKWQCRIFFAPKPQSNDGTHAHIVERMV